MSLLALQAALMGSGGTSVALAATVEDSTWVETDLEGVIVYVAALAVEVVGGTAPYAYLWEVVTGTCEFDTPTSATTSSSEPSSPR